MRAITLRQPWATLLIDGVKHHETRSWALPETVRGRRVLIHAGKAWTEELHTDVHRELTRRYGTYYRSDLLTSAIIGSIVFTDCGQIQKLFPFDVNLHQMMFGDYGPDRWIWRCTDRMRFDTPILNVKGRLGIWTYEGGLL